MHHSTKELYIEVDSSRLNRDTVIFPDSQTATCHLTPKYNLSHTSSETLSRSGFSEHWIAEKPSLIPSFAFCVTIQDDIRHEKWWENCGEAYCRLILPLLHSFLVSLLLATKVESLWSWVREEWTSLPCLIHGALKEGDHFLRAQRPTRKSVQSMRSQSWFKGEMSQLGLQAFSKNKAIRYNNNPGLQRVALFMVK